MNFLIPKARTEQARWRSKLKADKHELTFVDPWCMTVLPETATMRSIWMNLDEYCGVICVSPTAAQVLVDALDTYWPMPPAEIHWLCNGPRTADVLKTQGLTPVYPNSGHTAEDVLQLPQAQAAPNDKWLIVKGDGGRVTYRETFEQRGVNVTETEVYHREVDIECLQKLPEIAHSIDVIWLSSEFLAQRILQVAPNYWQQWSGQWWVSSLRLNQWAEEQGLVNIRLASGATPEALNNLIRQSCTA